MLSPNQAAKKAGVSRKTIMNHIRDLSLKATRNNENHWSIHPTDLANWMQARKKQSQLSPTIPTTPVTSDTTTPTPTHTEVELRITKLELAHAKGETEQLKKQVARLEQEVKETRGQMMDMFNTMKDVTTLLASQRVSHTDNIFLDDEPLILTPEMRVKRD